MIEASKVNIRASKKRPFDAVSKTTKPLMSGRYANSGSTKAPEQEDDSDDEPLVSKRSKPVETEKEQPSVSVLTRSLTTASETHGSYISATPAPNDHIAFTPEERAVIHIRLLPIVAKQESLTKMTFNDIVPESTITADKFYSDIVSK